MRAKAVLNTAVTAAFLAGAVSSAWSKGIFVTPGARANALGGAYSAIADDSSAIYWNPAGLTQVKGNTAEFSGFYVNAPVTGNKSLNNKPANLTSDSANGDFPFGGIYPTEPATYTSKEFNTAAFIPFLGGTTRISDLSIGLGYYGAGGGGGIFEDTVSVGPDSLYAKLEGAYGFSVANVSAAKEVLPGLSVGLGLDFIGYFEKQEARKAYSGAGGYLFNLKVDGTGSGVQLNGGLLYKVLPNLRAGLVYRTGATIKISGTSTFTQNGLANFGYPNAVLESSYDKNYTYPTTYGISAAYEPSDKLTLAFALDQTKYAPAKTDITYKNPVPGLFVNTNTDAKLKDVTQYHLGAEYRYTDRLAFRGGIQNDPVDTPTEKLTLTNTDQFDFTYYSLGAGYRIGNVSLDFTYLRGITNTPSTAGRDYGYSHNEYRFASSYKF